MSLLLAVLTLMTGTNSDYVVEANCVYATMNPDAPKETGQLPAETAQRICQDAHHWTDRETDAALRVAIARLQLDAARHKARSSRNDADVSASRVALDHARAAFIALRKQDQ